MDCLDIGQDQPLMLKRRRAANKPPGAVTLRLPFPPVAERMPEHAANLVKVVHNVDGIDLDYRATSLADVDRLLGKFYDAGDDPDRMPETLFLFGAYIGEVIARSNGGAWVHVEDDHPLGGGWPLVQLPDGHLLNPIGKAFKRVGNGPTDSILYFAQALAGM